jgi:hypothetical protein
VGDKRAVQNLIFGQVNPNVALPQSRLLILQSLSKNQPVGANAFLASEII